MSAHRGLPCPELATHRKDQDNTGTGEKERPSEETPDFGVPNLVIQQRGVHGNSSRLRTGVTQSARTIR